MFCPQCGIQAEPGIKYCKQCGQALNRIRGVMARGGANANWGEAWYEEALEEHRRKRRKTPEEKRYDEIKGGVITTVTGVAATIFLYFLMNTIADSEGGKDALILRTIWLCGLVPTFVGLGILFNGIFISKRIVELRQRQESELQPPQPLAQPLFTAVDTGRIPQLSEPAAPVANDYSVTEHTTTRLGERVAAKVPHQTN